MNLESLLKRQRAFFDGGSTRPESFRRAALERLLHAIESHRSEIAEALYRDLRKSEAESWMTEIGFVRNELRHALKNLKRWMRPRRVASPLFLFPARSEIRREPYGVALILAPWNYPFQLFFAPLIGAVAAGNCVVAKPSDQTPHTARIIRKIVTDAFLPEHVACFGETLEERATLLSGRYDTIFYTGGTRFGREVLTAAARHFTPVTLELGGKSPCIVDRGADLTVAARRIVWGKFLNCGQTCVAPDYLWVRQELKTPLLTLIRKEIAAQYGADPKESPDYGRIVNDRQWERLITLLQGASIVFGGRFDRESRYLEPTLLDSVGWDDPVMQEEIFGPLLPVLAFDELDTVIARLQREEHPLALYYFSDRKKEAERLLTHVASGGACINDTVVHTASDRLPFGGVGQSGTGRYHGRFSFDTFSHIRSVIRNRFHPDFRLRYPPYRKTFRWIKRLL